MNNVKLAWLRGSSSANRCVTFGVPWAAGELKDLRTLEMQDETYNPITMQTYPRAFWPDRSIKWTIHSANLSNCSSNSFILTEGREQDKPISMITESGSEVIVDTGLINVRFQKSGNNIISQIKKGETVIAENMYASCIIERRESSDTVRLFEFKGRTDEFQVEETGPVRTVVKVSGMHVSNVTGERIIPFILRFYFFNGSDEIRIVHTFLYDGDASKDFIKGIGLHIHAPISGELYNRHVYISGDGGFFHEPLKLLNSWRPRIDAAVYDSQLQGKAVHFKDDSLNKAIDDMTKWDCYKVHQDSSEHFVIRKRTVSDSCAYIDALHGSRSEGLMAVCCENNGIALGMRNFWQKHPSAMEIKNASMDTAKISMWVWPPDSAAADLRHYDTEAHMNTYYEGFDEIRSTPYGTANTNEFFLWALDSLVSPEQLSSLKSTLAEPPLLVCEPEYYHSVRAFGTWSLPSFESEQKKDYENILEKCVDFYKREVEQRKWYGLFNYGDFMHTYDDTRHCWRYDMGGYAWQNTELVPTLWLWLYFMRTGRSDVFELAEAMTRHTSEVDVYHIGEYKGLGSRHNVIHWGCSCKEARIAMAGHHRFYYYMTGDERIGDVFDDVRDADWAIERLDPLRFFYNDSFKTHARTGPDWSSFCSNWMTAWERKNDLAARDKIIKGIECLKPLPLRLSSGSDFGYDPEDGTLIHIGDKATGGSHLVICMGAPQIWFELADSLKDPVWDEMLAEYGARYTSGGASYPYMAGAMIAYAAKYKNDPALADKVWDIMFKTMEEFGFEEKAVENYPSSFVKTDVKSISTNFISQWALNIIMCLEFIGDRLNDRK